MDLKKCVIEGKYKLSLYCKKGEVINDNNCDLLGFKDNLPVLSNNNIMIPSGNTSSIESSTKKTLKVEVNSQTGEKFINLNGKKLKMVPESELPAQVRKNAQLMKVASANGLPAKKPVKIKIIGTTSSLVLPANLTKEQESQDIDKNTSKPNVNNKADNSGNNNSDLSQKAKLIKENKLPTVKNPSIDKAVIARATSVGCVDQIEKNTENKNVKLELNNCQDNMVKTYKNKSGMKLFDLPTVNKRSRLQAVPKNYADKSVQTDSKFENTCTQTDVIFPNYNETQENSNLLNLDSINLDEIINSLSNTLPSQTMTYGSPEIASKNVDTVQDKRISMFFTDLRSALHADDKGNMPIHIGVLTNDVNFVKRSCNILRALQQSVDILNHGNLTALQLAIFNDSRPEIVRLLLLNGASLEVTDPEGNSIFHLAVEYERTEILDIIFKTVDVDSSCLDSFNAEGLTALMICCCNRLITCADLLLRYDADVNIRDRKSGRTALFHAAENHDLELVQLLIHYKADTKIKNFFGTSPHDAMYEVDEIPEPIKTMILGRSSKRKIVEDTKTVKTRKIDEQKKLKTYARYKRIDDFEFSTNYATGRVK